MAKKWIQAMHMKEGALTAKAKAAHKTLSEFMAHPPKNASDTTMRQIHLAQTLRKMHK
jgi:hypothetical protein